MHFLVHYHGHKLQTLFQKEQWCVAGELASLQLYSNSWSVWKKHSTMIRNVLAMGLFPQPHSWACTFATTYRTEHSHRLIHRINTLVWTKCSVFFPHLSWNDTNIRKDFPHTEKVYELLNNMISNLWHRGHNLELVLQNVFAAAVMQQTRTQLSCFFFK